MGAHRILGEWGALGKYFCLKNVGYVLFLLYYSIVLFGLDERYHLICE